MRLPRVRRWLIVCGALIVAFGVACSSSSGDGSDLAAPPDTQPASIVAPAPTVIATLVPTAGPRVEEPPAASLPVLDAAACDLARPRLAVAPDGSGFLALSQGIILSRYDAGGCHVDDLVVGINTGVAFDVAWSPAGDRYAYAVVAPPQSPGFTALRVSYFELRARAAGEIGRDPYRAISGHGFPVAGDEVWLVWSPDGSRLAMLNGTLLVLTDEDGDVVARLTVDPSSGPPGWSADGVTLILAAGDSTEEQRCTR